MSHRQIFRLVFMVWAVCAVLGCGDKPPYEADLERLDNMMEGGQTWIDKKVARIGVLQEKLHRVVNQEERFWTYKDIYKEYREFDADSAGKYAQLSIRIAAEMGNREQVFLCRLDQMSDLIQTGWLDEAEKAMKGMDLTGVSDYARMQYLAQMMCLYQAYAYYMEDQGTEKANRSRYFNMALQYRDSVLRYVTPSMPEYLNIKAWHEFDANRLDTIKRQLKKRVDASAMENVDDAVSAYLLASICREQGEKNDQMHYLVASAMGYIRAACRNYASETWQDLSNELMLRGDVYRAYRYINYCSANLMQFKNRAQLVRLHKTQESIGRPYLKHERGQSRLIALFLGINSTLAIVLIAAVFYIVVQMRRLSRNRNELANANELLKQGIAEKEELNGKIHRRNRQLTDLNTELTNTNDSLTEANAVKEKYIGYTFTLCAGFIDRIDTLRRDVSRKLKFGKREEAIEYVSSPDILQKELRAFHSGFDKTFLDLYPDFVERLNALVTPGQEIVLKDSSRLNTDLRVVALMRLGITDCEKIAEFLHCSVQSVYNSRRAVYGRLSITPKEFKECISKLGTPHTIRIETAKTAESADSPA